MRNVLATVIVGMFVLVAGGVAFAGEPGKDSVDHEKFPPAAVSRADVTPAVVSRAEATNTGTIADPSKSPSVWIEMRYDNYGR